MVIFGIQLSKMDSKIPQKLNSFNSLIEVIEYFKEEQIAIEYLTEKRWGGNINCPHCSATKVYSFSDNKRFKCASCRQQFTSKVGTIFEDSKIQLRKWFVAVYLITSHKKGISSHQLAKDLKVTQKTGWFMLHRIRFALGNGSFEMPIGGEGETIAVDETFAGGKNKNRQADKKVENSQGRSFKDKTPVIDIIQNATTETIERQHKVIADHIVKEKVVLRPAIVKCVVAADTSSDSLQPAIEAIVKHGSIVVSDEWLGYNKVGINYDHRIVDHKAKEYVNANGDTTNAIEGFWMLFKRSYIGIYHYMSRKHLQKYADEMAFRYNTRHISEGGRVNFMMGKIQGRLTYKALTQKA